MINVNEAISPYENYCDGYGNPGSSGKGYFVGLALGVDKAKLKFNHIGSDRLDGINAFDRAEVSDVNIGQINMINVSSFCGPQGLIWGYHVVQPKKLFTPHSLFPQGVITYRNKSIPVYSAGSIIDASRSLFGTLDHKRYPLHPGAHIPCAGKNIKREGPANLYCSVGVGIAENSDKNANLIMEDVGEIPFHLNEEEKNTYKSSILEKLAMSILAIGKNQKVRYKEMFVEIRDINVEPGEIGCALVAAPYFTLARRAIPKKSYNLAEISLQKWANLV
jgi:histidine decarboxylase